MRLSLKLLLISELVLLTAVVALVMPVWLAMREQVVENMQNELKAIASTGALQIDGDEHAMIRTPDDVAKPAFRAVQATLENVRAANDVKLNHIYTFFRDGDQMRFAVMLNPDDELFVGDTYPIQPLMHPVLDAGTMEATRLYTDDYGTWISAYAPIRDGRGDVVGLLAVDKDSGEYFDRFISYTVLTVALGLLVLAVTSILGYIVLQRIVIRPVFAVREGMLALGRRDFRHRVQLETNDELQELGQTLNAIAEQLDVARAIQEDFFPTELPKTDVYGISAVSMPCDATGGDYYDVIALPGDRIALVIGDVSGHGLGPSLLMASCRSALRGLSRTVASPGRLMTELQDIVAPELGGRRFITMLYGVLERDGTFTYSNFGHGPALLVANGRVETLTSHRPPLGVVIDLPDEPIESTHRLQHGERVLLASDGLSEAMSPTGELLGDGPIEAIAGDAGLAHDDVVRRLVEIQIEHSGGRSVTDDVTILCVDRTDPGGTQ